MEDKIYSTHQENMILLLNYIQTHLKETKRLIGITLQQFNQLVEVAKLAEKILK